MDVLWFNWKDIKNPEAGGAEVYTHQIAKRLVERGYNITLFASAFKGCSKEETVDGVRIVREGGRYTVYERAKPFYKRNHCDLVVDEINTKPFLTPKFVDKEKVIGLIHQLAREFWFYEMPFPLDRIGYHLEDRWLRNYVDIPMITVSNSTKKDLEELGFKRVSVVNNGLNVEPVNSIPNKTDKPTVIYVGRMKKAKKPQDVVEAFKVIKREINDAELWMVGDGYLKKNLESNSDAQFFGYVDIETKNDLVKKAWVIAVPGVREGWGQVVTDANALGTPAAGYNVPGLKDSIKDGFNGLLVEPEPNELAKGVVKVLSDDGLREELSANAIEWSKQFSWDKSADGFEEVLQEVLDER